MLKGTAPVVERLIEAAWAPRIGLECFHNRLSLAGCIASKGKFEEIRDLGPSPCWSDLGIGDGSDPSTFSSRWCERSRLRELS